MRATWLALGCCALLACTHDEPSPDAGREPTAADGGSAQPHVEYLTPTQHLVRASMALRGLRPSLDELQAVRENPKYVAAIVDYYLESEQFGEVMRELHAEALLVVGDPVIYPAGFPSLGKLSKLSTQQLNQSLVDAPLRLIEHVITHDRPYSEIITADYTLADDVVATVWGMPYDGKGETWQETHYADERPSAGILSDSFLFTRHSTTFSNKSRGRANLVSRALLCYDFLSREIPIDTSINLADSEAVTNAVKHNPACVACHESLDPLAAYFAPFRPIYLPSDIKTYPYTTYFDSYSKPFSVSEPGFFGEPGHDLRDLGAAIAKDPAFSLCAAKRFYSYFTQVELDAVPDATARKLRDVFVDKDLSAKALARAVVLSDDFRASHADDDVVAEALVGLKKVSPQALSRMIEDLTGYHWETSLPYVINKDSTGPAPVGDIDLMNDAFFGWKVLAGGVDGQSVTRASHTMSATVALVADGLAARASKYVVEQDLARTDKSKRRLLGLFDENDTTERSVRAQLVALQLRLYGEVVAAGSPEVDAAYTLFSAALAESNGGVHRALTVTLYAMLQDPRMLYY